MLAELFAVAFLMQNAPTTAPAIPSTPATPPAAAPATTPPATLAAKWPQKVAEANEDIVGVVAKGTPIFKWSEGHNFTEGPACATDGSVWFVDIPANEILRVDPNGAQVVTRKANATFGLFVGADGNLYGAQASPGAITRVDPKSGEITVLCEKRSNDAEGTGRALGRLNDLVIGDGGVWFTAPVIGRKRAGMPPDAVYFVPLAGGEATEVVRDDKVRAPNGIDFHPMERRSTSCPTSRWTSWRTRSKAPESSARARSSIRFQAVRAKPSAATVARWMPREISTSPFLRAPRSL